MHWCGVDLQFISSTHPENEIITEEQRIESIQQTLSLTDTKIAQYRTLFHDLDKDGNGTKHRIHDCFSFLYTHALN